MNGTKAKRSGPIQPRPFIHPFHHTLHLLQQLLLLPQSSTPNTNTTALSLFLFPPQAKQSSALQQSLLHFTTSISTSSSSFSSLKTCQTHRQVHSNHLPPSALYLPYFPPPPSREPPLSSPSSTQLTQSSCHSSRKPVSPPTGKCATRSPRTCPTTSTRPTRTAAGSPPPAPTPRSSRSTWPSTTALPPPPPVPLPATPRTRARSAPPICSSSTTSRGGRRAGKR